jgi:hypothetical protein
MLPQEKEVRQQTHQHAQQETKSSPDDSTARSRNDSKFVLQIRLNFFCGFQDTKPKLDMVLVEHASLMKGAIPVLPVCLAYFCLICNIFIPGSGNQI